MNSSEICTILATVIVTVLLMISSCTSSKDTFKNPYHAATRPSLISASDNYFQPELDQQPDWIYAVSKDFIVGTGSGKDISEAKNAALNDIKSFIVKSLGETGNVVEINFVSNIATGRNNAQSQETYLMKNHFESKYKPVINISIDRFEDYYYENDVSSASYFIKYRLDATEIERIKGDYSTAIYKSNLSTQRIHRTVDSLTSVPKIQDNEPIVERYNSALEFYYDNDLDPGDSLKLVRFLKSLGIFISNVHIKILEHEKGAYIRFGLFSDQFQLKTLAKPSIYVSGVIKNTLIQTDGIWELRYKTIENQQAPGKIEINYQLPQGVITSEVIVPASIPHPAFEIIDRVQLSNFQIDSWNGVVRNLSIRMSINFQDDYPGTINSIELRLHSVSSAQAAIYIDDLNLILIPGVNSFAKTIKVDLPMRLFLARESNGDLIVFYTSEKNKAEKIIINNIPISINK